MCITFLSFISCAGTPQMCGQPGLPRVKSFIDSHAQLKFWLSFAEALISLTPPTKPVKRLNLSHPVAMYSHPQGFNFSYAADMKALIDPGLSQCKGRLIWVG